MALDSNFFDDMAKRLLDAIPPGMKDLHHDLQKTFKTILQSTFAKLDLVTRDEFETQSKVLQKTRQKLDMLEKHVKEMEKKK